MVLPAKDVGVNGKDDKPELTKDEVLGARRFVARIAEYEESKGQLTWILVNVVRKKSEPTMIRVSSLVVQGDVEH
jgi:hypothetical protein